MFSSCLVQTSKPAATFSKLATMVEAQKMLVADEYLVDTLLFFGVDILSDTATLVFSSFSASKLVERAWKTTVVLLRKMQSIPALEAAAFATDGL